MTYGGVRTKCANCGVKVHPEKLHVCDPALQEQYAAWRTLVKRKRRGT